MFSNIKIIDVHDDVMRNIVSLRHSQDLFDDLTDDTDAWAFAQQVEANTKPAPYRSHTPAIHRPFEEASWFTAIGWPFQHWQSSRFSDGSFGVWYGANSVETTVYECAYHWYYGLLADAGFQHEDVVSERKVYRVYCEAALLDFRRAAREHARLLHKTDYSFAQSVGSRLHKEGHPGLLVPSVRWPQGVNYVIFNPAVLSQPRLSCFLTFRLAGDCIHVEKEPGVTWLNVHVSEL